MHDRALYIAAAAGLPIPISKSPDAGCRIIRTEFKLLYLNVHLNWSSLLGCVIFCRPTRCPASLTRHKLNRVRWLLRNCLLTCPFSLTPRLTRFNALHDSCSVCSFLLSPARYSFKKTHLNASNTSSCLIVLLNSCTKINQINK